MGIADIISLLGGLAFFLFGMSLLGSGLKRVAGGKMETILSRLSSNPVKGVLLGAVVTAVIQSSSATTVMVVGFVNSGIMQLSNAVGIVMGANIGTTATSWLLTLVGVEGGSGFSSATVFALVAFIGIVLYFFCKRQIQQNVGMILLAFSVLMSGMQTMSASMNPLKESPAFLGFISAVSNPVFSLIVGILVTAVIQSASASVGILQALSVTGAISYEVAVPMVLGMCIGACVPVLLSAIGANINGKRTALIYLYYNVIGTAILSIPFYLYHAFVGIPFMALPATAFGIAVVNTVYKVIATLIQLPFTEQLVRLSKLTVKDLPSDEDDEEEVNLLDERFLNYPPLAVMQSGETINAMAAAAIKNLNRSFELFDTFSSVKYDKIMSREGRVDRYEDSLGKYLVRLSGKDLHQREAQLVSKYLHCMTDLERLSDYAVNLADLAKELEEKDIDFSKSGTADLRVCFEALREILSLTQKALADDDMEAARQVEPLENVIDSLLDALKLRHVRRLQDGSCTLEIGFVFNDCVNNFERIAAHCSNVALAVLQVQDDEMSGHAYSKLVNRGDQPELHQWTAFYEEKYLSYIEGERQEENAQ